MNKLKRIARVLGPALALLITLLMSSCTGTQDKYALDPSEYNTEDYPLPELIFISELPQGSEVVYFSYYNTLYKFEEDYYLEVKFTAEQQMTEYYEALTDACLASLEKSKLPAGESEWLIEQENPYDSSYTDVFCLGAVSPNYYNRDYLGYRQEIIGTTNTCSSNFAVISYSYEELTIIQSFTKYQYYEKCSNYIPAYFRRFNVPVLEEGLERVFYDENEHLDATELNIVDLTDEMTEFMQSSAARLLAYKNKHGTIKAMLYFYECVNDGGVWDIKLQDFWKFKFGTMYTFRGKRMRSDDPGNICFAYIGGVLFSRETLCIGAGINQTTKYDYSYGSMFTSYYDDPRDTVMIRYGHDLYTGKG